LNDDTDAQERIIKHLIVPYAKGEFLQSDLHEYAGGRLSASSRKTSSRFAPLTTPADGTDAWHISSMRTSN